MHPIAQICGLVLLSAVTGENWSLRKQVPKKIADISPYQWAVHDWVPQKNRRIDFRSMPIGAGELEKVPHHDQRRMPKRKPGHRALRKSRNHQPRPVNDVLKKHILNSYKHVKNEMHDHLQRAHKERRRHLARKNLGRKKQMPLFPKNFKKVEWPNQEVKETEQYKGDVYLPVYRQVLDNVKTYKKLEEDHLRKSMDNQLMQQQKEAAIAQIGR